MGNAASTMDIGETLAIRLEKLKKIENGDNELLPNIEKYVQGEISALLDTEAPIRELFTVLFGHYNSFLSSGPGGVVELSGSVVEGATTARIFQVDKDLELEIDVMVNIFTIPQARSPLVETVKDKPGFVRLPFYLLPVDRIRWYIGEVKKFLGHHENTQYSWDQIQHYISPLVVRDYFVNSRLRLLMTDVTKQMRDLLCLDLHVSVNEKKIFPTETTAASETVMSGVRDLGLPVSVMSDDMVPAINLSFWPHQASDWISRYRVWPPHDTIQSIVEKGCQVVPRTSPGGDVHSEWRLSFSRPEATLAKMRSREQQETYYFFKMFFYRYLKRVQSSETEGKTLYSYIIKSIMLWACEELHPEDKIWASLENSVQILLFKLLGSLELGLLSHYFIPEINLLDKVGQDVRKRCIAVIRRWISNVLMTAPFDLPEKREVVRKLGVKHSVTGAVLSASARNGDLFEAAKKGIEEYWLGQMQ